METSRRTMLTALLAGSAAGLCGCSLGEDPPPAQTSDTGLDGSDSSLSTSAKAAGGMDMLVRKAQSEGKLNVIALLPDWVNYGALIKGFQDKYRITVVSDLPHATSQEEISTVIDRRGAANSPDVLDIGAIAAALNANLFAPYQVELWGDIDASQREPSGRWVQGYGGYMAMGYNPELVSAPTRMRDLLGPDYRGKVALTGDPRESFSALNAVALASLAEGGSLDDVSKGIAFFAELRKSGNLVPGVATADSVKSGSTPVVLDWDYVSTRSVAQVPTWQVKLPAEAVIGGYYAQAINKDAPHPAAARLWQEYLFSNDGQNMWLRGGARPVRMNQMRKSGDLDLTALDKLPRANGPVRQLTQEQVVRARQKLTIEWGAAISD